MGNLARALPGRHGKEFFLRWALPLIHSLMNFVSLLSHWMLPSPIPVSLVGSHHVAVRILSKNGSIVRMSPGATITLWPPLVLPLTNTGKRSTMWFLLQTTNATLGSRGWTGEENGEELQMWCTLSFQEPQRGPFSAEKPGPKN